MVVRDTPQVINTIAGIIDEIDIEPRQIIIEARLVEVVLDDDNASGVDWLIRATLSGSSIPSTLPFIDKRGTYDDHGDYIPKPDMAGGSTGFASGSLFPYSASGDFTFGRISFADFQAVLELLDEKDKSNLLSAPHIATLEGEEASIVVGTNIPIPIYERNEETGSMEITGYEEKETGIVLRVTPHIVGVQKIMLRLHPEVSELTGQFVGPNNERPITSSREAETTITVRDGDTVIMAGLIRENIVEQDHKVPLLGYIPFLGAPFRYKSSTVDRTELIIFVTPRIIKNNDFQKVGDFAGYDSLKVKYGEDQEEVGE